MRTNFESVAPPTVCSPIPDDADLSNAEAGAALQRLPLTPQGRYVAGVLGAKRADGLPQYKSVVVQIPRRATKTTSIQNELLGRCANIPGYIVVSTAQDGTRASEFIQDLMDSILQYATELTEEHNDEIEETWSDPEKEPVLEVPEKWGLRQLGIRQLYRSQGREQIKWLNGSKWRAVPPEQSKMRGKGVRVLWVDEGGELDPDEGPALLGGALPMLDTSPDAQFIISGTPGTERRGAFWHYLELGRADPEARGIVDYHLDDYADPLDRDLWPVVHPGLACGLTSLETLEERLAEMGIEQFLREYLCRWPEDTTTTAMNLKNWTATGRAPKLDPPAETWALGFDVDPTGKAYAVAAAWYAQGSLHVQILRHRSGGTGTAQEYISRGLMKFPRVKCGFDSIGQNVAIADELRTMRRIRPVQIKALTMKDAGAGTALIAKGTDDLSIWHAEHPELERAVENTTWRLSGETRLFRAGPGKEITALRAALAAAAVVNKERRADADETTSVSSMPGVTAL